MIRHSDNVIGTIGFEYEEAQPSAPVGWANLAVGSRVLGPTGALCFV